MMDEAIKELTLLLIYFTSWQEEAASVKVQRSWKGYTFKILDELGKFTSRNLHYYLGNLKARMVY